jgi:hypothetical protein
MPTALKKAAQRRVERENITLTEFLNTATHAYVRGELDISHPEIYATPKAIARIKKIIRDAEQGKNVSGPFTLEESNAHLRKLMR